MAVLFIKAYKLNSSHIWVCQHPDEHPRRKGVVVKEEENFHL